MTRGLVSDSLRVAPLTMREGSWQQGTGCMFRRGRPIPSPRDDSAQPCSTAIAV